MFPSLVFWSDLAMNATASAVLLHSLTGTGRSGVVGEIHPSNPCSLSVPMRESSARRRLMITYDSAERSRAWDRRSVTTGSILSLSAKNRSRPRVAMRSEGTRWANISTDSSASGISTGTNRIPAADNRLIALSVHTCTMGWRFSKKWRVGTPRVIPSGDFPVSGSGTSESTLYTRAASAAELVNSPRESMSGHRGSTPSRGHSFVLLL